MMWAGVFKRAVLILGSFWLVLLCAGCQGGQEKAAAQNEIFHSLAMLEEEETAVAFTADLSQGQADFLFLNLAADAQVTLQYTYSTQGQADVVLGIASAVAGRTIISLAAAEEEAYQAIWQEETITLRAGLNVFYLTGADCISQMTLSIIGLEPANVLYADIRPEM